MHHKWLTVRALCGPQAIVAHLGQLTTRTKMYSSNVQSKPTSIRGATKPMANPGDAPDLGPLPKCDDNAESYSGPASRRCIRCSWIKRQFSFGMNA